jgi:hypothetical protein
MGHRFYVPSSGRFLNRDPIGFSRGLNLFEAMRSNPVTFTDHTGLDPYSFTGGIPNGQVSLRVSTAPGIINTGLDGGKVIYGFTIDVTSLSTGDAYLSFSPRNIQALIVTDLTKNEWGVLQEITDNRFAKSNCNPYSFPLAPGQTKPVKIEVELAIDPEDLPLTTWKMNIPLLVESSVGRWSLRPPFYHEQRSEDYFTLKQRFIVDKIGGTTQSSEF